MLDVDYGHAQYSVTNAANMDSMADDGLEGINKNLSNLVLKKEDLLVQMKYKSYSQTQMAGFIYSLQEEGCNKESKYPS